jgi:ribosomal protein L31E
MAKEFKEKTITINLSKVFEKPVTRRVVSAKHIICEGVKKETRLKELKISTKLNELLWSRGKYYSQRKITVKIINEKGLGRIMLPEEKYEAKQERKDSAKTTKEVAPVEAKVAEIKKEEPVAKKEDKAKEKKTSTKKE